MPRSKAEILKCFCRVEVATFSLKAVSSVADHGEKQTAHFRLLPLYGLFVMTPPFFPAGVVGSRGILLPLSSPNQLVTLVRVTVQVQGHLQLLSVKY